MDAPEMSIIRNLPSTTGKVVTTARKPGLGGIVLPTWGSLHTISVGPAQVCIT